MFNKRGFLKSLISGCIVIFVLNGSSAQNRYSQWEHYTSGRVVNDMAEEGNTLWIATNGGLVKYNQQTGDKQFFNHGNSIIPSLRINGIAIDKKHNKWLATGAGLVKFKGQNWQMHHPPDSLNLGSFQWITVAPTGKIWLGSSNNIIKFNRINKWEVKEFSNLNFAGDIEFNSIVMDSSGNKWLGTSNGIIKFNDTSTVLYDTSNSALLSKDIKTVYIDNADNKFFGTYAGGLTLINDTNWSTMNTVNSGIPGNTILGIQKSKDGNLWIGTFGQGAGKFNGEKWTVYDTSKGLPNDYVFDVLIDSTGDKWFGTLNNLGSYDGNTVQPISTSNAKLPYNRINALAFNQKTGKIWAASPGSLVSFDGKEWKPYVYFNSGLPNVDIISLAIDKAGNKWIGAKRGLIKYDGKNWDQLSPRQINEPLWVNQIYIDKNDNKWFSTRSGLIKYDDQNWTVFDTSNTGLPDNRILSFALDKAGNKWVGAFSGLAHFNGSEWKVFTPLNTALKTRSVDDISVDNSGNKWFATINGLTKYDGSNWKTYDQDNSNIKNEKIENIALDSQGNIWLGTDDNYVDGHPGHLYKFDGQIWTNYKFSNSGLPPSGILAMVFDDQNRIWTGSLDGLSVFTPQLSSINENSSKGNPFNIAVKPNPFKNQFRLTYTLPNASSVTIQLFNAQGKLVKTIQNQARKKGQHHKTISLKPQKPGLYFFKLQAEQEKYMGKLIKNE